MRILGIDYGDSKIGIAMSDPLGWTAQGIETIKYTDINIAIQRICEIVNNNKIEKIIIGFPKNMNGTIGPRGEKTDQFIILLKNYFSGEIIKWDERLTTVAAENLLISADVSRKDRKKVVDKIAACYILQGYLDYNSSSNK